MGEAPPAPASMAAGTGAAVTPTATGTAGPGQAARAATSRTAVSRTAVSRTARAAAADLPAPGSAGTVGTGGPVPAGAKRESQKEGDGVHAAAS